MRGMSWSSITTESIKSAASEATEGITEHQDNCLKGGRTNHCTWWSGN
jgi:hypothetical protein